MIVGNPPYGERLGDKKAVQQMYKEMGQAFAELETWSIYMLTSDEEFETIYGKKRQKNVNSLMGLLERIIINIGESVLHE